MQTRLDFATDDRTTGFRLEEFELYNWGTYNKKILHLNLNKANALLTGDIGSGKSTIVDAITTLLVPHNKITFNKAAGAKSKERSIYSYIVGEYKTTQDENFQISKAVSLRDESNFSVILARFENIGFDENITIAQFFYISQKQVQKIFVVSKSKLHIEKDFFNVDNIRNFKKRLRKLEFTQVFDGFKEYSRAFRREMGLKNEQALNLFYQTVSLKSIGNLTEFIRTHMLEDSLVDEEIDELCKNFAELNHTHNLILEAKKQIELLKPIQKEYIDYQTNYQNRVLFLSLRESLEHYFGIFNSQLIALKLKELNIELIKKNSQKQSLAQSVEKLNDDILDIRLELEKNGANRINEIDKEIKQLTRILQESKAENNKYNALAKELGFIAVSNEHRFLSTQDKSKKRYEDIEQNRTKYQNNIVIDTQSHLKYSQEIKELEIEILYLQNNPSNIPQRVSKIRDDIVKAFNLDISKLPFIGELINVLDEQWNGAIERILHRSALSLLVDKNLYEKVSEYVDKTNLKGKLIYLKVDTNKRYTNFLHTNKDSLLSKIEVKADSDFFGVVSDILDERFDIPCVDNLNDFRRFKRALSLNGQFKTNFTRHEKDDRFDISDKTRWVLGWNNLEKLQEFQDRYEKTKHKLEIIIKRLEETKKLEKDLQHTRDLLRDILNYKTFKKINWYRYSKDIDNLVDEKEELQKSNNIIKTLQDRLEKVKTEYQEQKYNLETITQKIGEIKQKIDTRELEYNRDKLMLENTKISKETKEKLDELKEKIYPAVLNLNTIKTSKIKLSKYIQEHIEGLNKVVEKVSNSLVSLQNNFIREFPIISKELYASVDSSEEFMKKLQVLKRDNLPKWEKRFKDLLKEKTIHNIIMLQSRLEEHSHEIKTKIQMINKSLFDIEYNDGTHIELLADSSKNAQIKDFRQSLKQMTTRAIDKDNVYDEQKFLQIKELIDRFNGRVGYVDVDKKWRQNVSDVRNWFNFNAVEKYISDESVKEYYAHSGGKSGGQKEKLAYTVLASSLAYQFGLEYNKTKSKSFRFVMIDEAFGRGSDESTRYALKLFEKLKLQLLVITPKQKINVIEPFVKSVHFVYNKDGLDSSLISMNIDEYQENRENRE